jgi:anti-sigma factor RsiW
MTTPQNRQLSDDELELLSAYIDNQLAATDRGALEQRLGRDPALRTALDELRGTVGLLHELTPLPPPRSFALDPVAFAPRPAPLFGWLRLGATLASVLLAITFAVEFASMGGVPASAPLATGGGAPAAAAPTAAAAAQRQAQLVTVAPDTLSAPAAAPAPAAAATAAPAAAEMAAEPTASTKAAEATAAPAAPEAPAAGAAAPTPSAEATVLALESADTSVSATPAAQPTLGLAQEPAYSAPLEQAPATGNIAPPTSAPIAASDSNSPDTDQLESSVPPEAREPAPQPAIQPIRLIQFSLAGLALLLGLGALWVRRRGR